MGKVASKASQKSDIQLSREEILQDYRIACESRETSLLGRKEVLTGKAKFGIFGDGKEVAQLAMARAFQPGDFRSGYYRDQTFLFANGTSDIQKFFAQLYAHTDADAEPASAGRSMNGHYATRSLNPDGSWKNLMEIHNSSADVSPTGSQMPRLVGLAYASVLYRGLEELKEWADYHKFSNNGSEIAFGTIGNASCAEGMFWEAVNAIGVLGAPAIISIWDDGYGISVPNKYQVTKDNVGELLQGFQRKKGTTDGYDIYVVKGWDYPGLLDAYAKAAKTAREEHVPAIIHVVEVTQPQGHSTSGSHERYKSSERLQWEDDFDPIKKMGEWIEAQGFATQEELDAIRATAKKFVKEQQKAAWEAFLAPIQNEIRTVAEIVGEMAAGSAAAERLTAIQQSLTANKAPFYRDIMVAVRQALMVARTEESPAKSRLLEWKKAQNEQKWDEFSAHLYSESAGSAMKVAEVPATFDADAKEIPGFQIINQYFDYILGNDPRVIAFGEDVGYLGDVNQGFSGMQEKYGELRVSDTGIRECTIMGQAIGMAMRGLRPIAEIQYLDYLLYGLQILSDDLATVQYRTKGGQKAPVIVRTRGHRLEGIWHSGSQMGAVLHLLRGMYVCVPRNFVQAAGMYNTLLQSDEPGLVVEVLNGYRLREKQPNNIGEYTVPMGVPETLREGADVTVVTYGPLCRLADEAADLLSECGIEIEIIDVQTLMPFDVNHHIVESLKKTSRIVFLDEDVPGGAAAFMQNEVIEKQGGYYWLDSEPRTLTAKHHRPAYGSDGDYWSKPSVEDIFECVYDLMHEVDPAKFPIFYR